MDKRDERSIKCISTINGHGSARTYLSISVGSDYRRTFREALVHFMPAAAVIQVNAYVKKDT